MQKKLLHLMLEYFQKNYSVSISLLFLSISIFCLGHTSAAQSKLKVATAQFPVSGDVHKNADYIKKLMREAALQKADVVHFSEASLTGYPPMDIPSFANYDWNSLSMETKDIMALAKELSIWVI